VTEGFFVSKEILLKQMGSFLTIIITKIYAEWSGEKILENKNNLQ
jgi:hypothetical protein